LVALYGPQAIITMSNATSKIAGAFDSRTAGRSSFDGVCTQGRDEYTCA
jgi:hypothetical protein